MPVPPSSLSSLFSPSSFLASCPSWCPSHPHPRQVKGVKGVKSVQRVVCGGCLDFKVVTALDIDSFGAWEASKFAPEEKFLAKIKAIPGVTQVETQTYTLMPM